MAVAYPYDGVLYLAATRRCTLACTFCPKQHGRWVVAGNDLRHDAEPSADASNAVGVYWGEGGATHHPEFVVNIAHSELPLPLWVGVSVASAGKTKELLSLGMPQLLRSAGLRGAPGQAAARGRQRRAHGEGADQGALRALAPSTRS